MKTIIALLLGLVLADLSHAAGLALSPEMQSTLDEQKKVIAVWAAEPILVTAVKAQNDKGPLPGMDNAGWKELKANDPLIQLFENSPAGKRLAEKIKAGKGLYTEAFLCAAKGEKVAFAAKPTSYLHAGTPKFDVPMSGQDWQGEPAFDESSQKNSIQLSTPVMDNGKAIGALVVGIAAK